MRKGISSFIVALLINHLASFDVQATETIYTDYNAWLSAVNASRHNLEVSNFETNYANVSNEKFVSSFPQLPSSSLPNYLNTRTDISFGGNNVSLGRHATFDSSDTGFDISFEISAVQSEPGRGDAYIYYNDIPQGKTPIQADTFTNVLSIGKFNGFDPGNGSEFDWDNDDFTLEITSDDKVYAVGFYLINNKQNINESLEVFTNKSDTGSASFDSSDGHSLEIFNNGSIPGYHGSYDSNYDDVRFVGIVSTTPFTWLEFDEGDSVNDIGLANFYFATPQIALHHLEINQTGSGSGTFSTNPTGTGCSSTADFCYEYNSGTSVSITANPSTSNDHFVSWSGCDSTSGQVCTVSLSANKTVEAEFEMDTDNDGVFNSNDNCPTVANASQINSDGDSAGNSCDAFPNNASETKDSDNDGMGDNFENTYSLNRLDSSDANIDSDSDNYTNLEEFLGGTNPKNFSSNPAPDTDNDGHKDGFDNCPLIANPDQTDTDNDAAGNLCDAFPNNASESKDSDNDGLGDNYETQHSLNPNNASDASQDSDDDGLTNLEEYLNGSDPNNIHDPIKKATVFWRNYSSGVNYVYLLDSYNILRIQQLNSVSLTWQIVATADFNGDGEKDILWRNSRSGINWIYIMKNANISLSQPLNTVADLNWKVVGTADFNGDNNDDILWHNASTGQTWMYLMNGMSITTSAPVSSTTPDWVIKETGDFNGDGYSDIVWQNNVTGNTWMYLMNGTRILQSKHVGFTALSWVIEGTGDFNNDGKDDLFWRNKLTGQNWIYLMNGSEIIQSRALNTVADLNWQIVQVEDFNHDNKADVLWRNTHSGLNWLYLLDGISIQKSKPINTVSDMNWLIVPTHNEY